MARLTILPLEGMEEVTGEGDLVNRDVAGILAHRPEASQALQAYIGALTASGTLPARLVELVRLRIAFHNQCRSCMSIRYHAAIDDGVTDDLVCSLEQPADSPDLTDAERAALRFADLFATNHLAIDDEVYDDLRRHFDEGEIVELGLHAALCVGSGRLASTWQVTDHVPGRFKEDGMVAPWGGTQLVAG